MVDLGDGGSSESEYTKSEKGTRETTKIEKVPKNSKLISQSPKNPFSLATKTSTLFKRNMFRVDILKTTSKVIGIESRLEDTLDRKRKRKEEGVPNKETLSFTIHSR